MAQIPDTSTTLLRDISGDALHARWGEFVARYRPMMEAFLRERFPYLEADDIIQETLIALVEKLPQYKYVPNEVGHFHNYLTGVLKRKALRVCARDKRRTEVMEDFQNEPPPPDASSIEATEAQNWRESIYEIALEQVLADDSIQSRTKQIFLRTAVDGEKPEDVLPSPPQLHPGVRFVPDADSSVESTRKGAKWPKSGVFSGDKEVDQNF